ncbi:uncharacterized protein [Hyperolius riggenbachi]|uniref:uncharacterized protein n=1 Tax=Hyperolius riggenbachi TaxID=752182 RepID=UPI0035A3C393
MSFVSGAQYTIYYGNATTSCCYNVTTKPLPVKSLQASNSSTTTVYLSWSRPDDYKSGYSYRVQTNTTPAATNTLPASESATITGLTPGATYTFMVYTRAANSSTESDPVSTASCTVPGQVVSLSVSSSGSVNSLAVIWTAPAGYVSYYNVTLSGDVFNTIQTRNTQFTFSGLSPGRNYTITVQTVSGSCSSTGTTVTQATYPNPPRIITFNAVGTNSTTISWGEAANMTNVSKSYQITYWKPSSPSAIAGSTTSTVATVTLQSLTSGANYTISVVTVGVRGYQSTAVTGWVVTKPLPVKLLQARNSSTTTVYLSWSRPDDYKSGYSYRLQTNTTSAATNTFPANESATITGLTPGATYTFIVYTRAADNSTESDPVSTASCTVPGQVASLSVSSSGLVNSLAVIWTAPAGYVSYYNVTISGDVNNTTQTRNTQVTLSGLSPGRNYTITVQTVSGSCSSTGTTVTQATYPTSPGIITFNAVGTNSTALSWGEAANMTNVAKSYNVTYWKSSSPSAIAGSTTSTTANVTLQNLTSGINYTISVVTVGVRGYQSTAVTRWVVTKPLPVKSLQASNSSTTTVYLSWSRPDDYKSGYSYRLQTNTTPAATNTFPISESATIMGLTPGATYKFTVYTRAANNSTESDPVSTATCTVPEQISSALVNSYQSVNSLVANWTTPAGNVSYYTVTIYGDLNNATHVTFSGLSPGRNYTILVQRGGGGCSSTSTTASEATYPTPPGMITFYTVGTNSTTLSWEEGANMAYVPKTYVITYWKSSSPSAIAGGTTSTTATVTLQHLTSGTNYTISVVTVGVRGYQSTAVTGWVVTKPLPVKSLQASNSSTTTVYLSWSRPDDYKSGYSYRVQTNTTLAATNIFPTNESATITGLTPGATYTFMVYTRAADNSTESDPVSTTTCTVPGQVASLSVSSSGSVNSLVVIWTAPAVGNVSYYNVTISGDVNNTTQTSNTQVTFSALFPGRNYTITVQTVSGSCSSTGTTVTQATYPTSPGNITVNVIGTNSTTFSWRDAANMAAVPKSYQITYWNSSSPSAIAGGTTSTTATVTLQNLTSGTNYTISVVTVGVRGYQSTAVTGSVVTKPLPVKSLQASNSSTTTVYLSWSRPDDYKSGYSYRVQTNATLAATNTFPTSESATIMGLTPGATYTFIVYTRAADNSTESDPVSTATCTVPGQVASLSVSSSGSVNSLAVIWSAPAGYVSYYNVTISRDVNTTTQTSNTQVTFSGLSPGRSYTITVQTVSGSCSSTGTTVTQATYPTPPGMITFNAVGINSTTLSWVEAANMTNVTKSYNITSWKSSSPSAIAGSTTSTTTNVTLQNLTSGTNYTISVVTVGVQGYQSTAVIGWVVTKPLPVKSLQASNSNSSTTTVYLSWSRPDDYKSGYSYRVQTNTTPTATNTFPISESATITSLTPGATYTFMVYTRAADNSTESDPVSTTTCTVPGQVASLSVSSSGSVNSLVVIWMAPAAGNMSFYNVTLSGDVMNTIQTSNTQVIFSGLSPGRNYTITVQTVSGSCSSTGTTVTQATYPTPPGMITFNAVGAISTTFSWGDAANMAGVTKSYNVTYWKSSSPSAIAGSTTSTTTAVTLQNLTSGVNYTISVVTLGVRGYQSTAVTGWVVTKPLVIKSLSVGSKTTSSLTVSWGRPDEYQSSYTYKVLTYITSSSALLSNTAVTNPSTTITSLTPGGTYTFTVYTVAADNVTLSDPLAITDCAFPAQTPAVTVRNNQSVNSLVVNWTTPAGYVSSYAVSVMGDVNNTVQTTSTQQTFTSLLPGRIYTIAVQTNSGSCSSAFSTASEATYPTPPGTLIFTSSGTKNIMLSWGNPINMTGVNKSYNVTYGLSSSTNTTMISCSNTNVTLQNLTSGSNYTISVVTIAALGYPSAPVTAFTFTKPFPVTNLQTMNVNSTAVSLNWTRVAEYQNTYAYRVLTSVTSSSTLQNTAMVANESATIKNLTAGETYTFTVYTVDADGVTISDPQSLTTCTVPGQAVSIRATSNQSVNSLAVTWAAPAGKTSYYLISLTGNATSLVQNTSTTQTTFSGLLPGREYNVSVQTVSGSCSQAAPLVTDATYPTPPGNITFTTIGSNNISLYWGEPINMAGVTKSYNITYWQSSSSSSAWSVTSNNTSVTLQNLTSGTNYTISMVTVGVRGYQSTAVRGSVLTR